jgi:putative endonuclease
MTFSLYIVRCSDNSLYTGITNDLHRRVKAHNEGRGAKYTSSRRPVVLVYEEQCRTKSAALKRETQIKGWTKARKEALVAAKLGSLSGSL